MGFMPSLQLHGAQRTRDDMDTDIREKTEVWFVGRRESTIRRWTIKAIKLSVEDVRDLLKALDERSDMELRDIEVEVEVGVYHIQGIATSEEVAVEMCRDLGYFIGPIPVNLALPHERCEWPEMYFPIEAPNEPDDNTSNR